MSERFDDVVRNAFDFLGHSIDELEKYPKYSVINFYSAIELFVKARLLKEHWTLIVAKPDQADKAKFERGNFQSVGLKDANERLMKIVLDGLMDEELMCFDGLRQERNQMVHFAHAAQGNDAGAVKEMERIVSDHAKGWLYLRRLLVGRWKEHFAAYTDSIYELDKRMREQTNALKPKFILLTDELKKNEEAGKHFMPCPSCGFKSFEVGGPLWVGYGICLTCSFCAAVLSMTCINEKCGQPILLQGGNEWCSACSYVYTPVQVDAVLEDSDLLQDTDMYDTNDMSHVSCGVCSGYETVVPLTNGEWFCTDCFDIEKDIGQCEWCTTDSTHVPEDSYLNGCSLCDGRIGYDKDD